MFSSKLENTHLIVLHSIMLKSLVEKLQQIEDYRKPKGKRHQLWVILTVFILGTISGFIGYRAIGDFCQYNEKALSKMLKIKSNNLPSYSTIRRVISGFDHHLLESLFNQWSQELIPVHQEQEYFSIDGKSLRNTVTDKYGNQQDFIVFISLFNHQNKRVYGLKTFQNKKGSEIPYSQDLITNSTITNAVFTLDALHCQKETTRKIIESDNDYLITVKKNQKKLYQSIDDVVKHQCSRSSFYDADFSHGRHITRKISVYNPPENIDPRWISIQSVIEVQREGFRGSKPYQQTLYYMSSLKEDAIVFAQKIREHWSIENNLHWIKDVILKEDQSPIKNLNAVINISILKTIALNLLRLLDFPSVTKAQRWLYSRLESLFFLLE